MNLWPQELTNTLIQATNAATDEQKVLILFSVYAVYIIAIFALAAIATAAIMGREQRKIEKECKLKLDDAKRVE